MANPATETHPIQEPTEPGLYEAARFPLNDGYNPYRITEEGVLEEFSVDGEYAITLDAIQTAAYGPWRKLGELNAS